MTPKQFAAVLGFAFVAAIIGFNFGYAILCLLGAGVGYAAGSFLQGELDIGDIQSRLSPSGSQSQPAPPPRPRPAGAPRVR